MPSQRLPTQAEPEKAHVSAVPTSVTHGRTIPDEEYVYAVMLELSDYALWANADLRRKLDANDGFASLKQLLPMPEPNENTACKALRLLADDAVEVRMVLSPPTWSNLSKQLDVGMYEVRRRQKSTLNVTGWSRNYWDVRTAYIERIPIAYRTCPSICHFLRTLFPSAIVESVQFPPHYLDKPGDTPKCKGFAFVVFSRPEDVDALVQEWPWDIRDSGHGHEEARKFGFHAIPKSRYEEMKSEYLAYRDKLVQDMAAESKEKITPVVFERAVTAIRPPSPPPRVSPKSMSYPPNCLVFVRHLHSQTNKTTLRALFSQAAGIPIDAIDYVDYTKGMDSCHVRLTSPTHTSSLAQHFQSHQVRQENGLDGEGKSSKSDTPSITVEIVQGKREEMYWDKVPEKIRKLSVQKVMGIGSASTGGEEAKERPAKRRKKR